MIWPVLVFLGVPFWLRAPGILTPSLPRRRLRARHGNVPVRVLRPGHTRWTRGKGRSVSDVFARRGSPAAWTEDLLQVVERRRHPATARVAAAGVHRAAPRGLFAPERTPTAP